MSKFLYPIYKLNIESYKKWWLYHKKAGGSGILSEILQGFSFNLENTLNRKFKLFEIEGNSVQDGSPSPDNEVPIYSAGDNGSINEKISNKNVAYFNILNKVPSISNGEMVDYNGAGSTDFIKIDNNQNYIFSYSSSKTSSKYIMFYDKTKNYLGHVVVTTNNYILGSYEKYNQTRYVKLRVDNLSDYNWLQLESGSTATPYVEHEEQDYSIPVQQPMRSIGDVRDCFVKKSDGWYERHKIYRKILDGTENWGADGYYYYLNNATYTIYSFSLCNYAIYKEKSDITNPTTIFALTKSGSNFIEFSKYNFSSVADFKAWLAELYANGTPVYIDYLSIEPQDLPCTEEQIQQIENKPSTYKDFTIIQSEDETEAYLKIQYWKEVHS